jgi:hypothetical protein
MSKVITIHAVKKPGELVLSDASLSSLEMEYMNMPFLSQLTKLVYRL